MIAFLNMKVSKIIQLYIMHTCNKDYSSKIDEQLKKRFKNTFKFSNNDIITFILLLR